MTEFEWVQRAKMQFAKRTGDYIFDWEYNAKVCFDEMRDGFESEPEDCADEEMSNWDDDND